MFSGQLFDFFVRTCGDACLAEFSPRTKLPWRFGFEHTNEKSCDGDETCDGKTSSQAAFRGAGKPVCGDGRRVVDLPPIFGILFEAGVRPPVVQNGGCRCHQGVSSGVISTANGFVTPR